MHDNITSIGHSAFSGCENLTNITIPGSVESIGSWAFNCGNLTGIIFENPIGWWVFENSETEYGVEIDPEILSDPTSALQALVYDYWWYFWKKD